METSAQIIFLNVPFKEKDSAKKLGAKWDKEARKWYYVSTPSSDKDDIKFWRWLEKPAKGHESPSIFALQAACNNVKMPVMKGNGTPPTLCPSGAVKKRHYASYGMFKGEVQKIGIR